MIRSAAFAAVGLGGATTAAWTARYQWRQHTAQCSAATPATKAELQYISPETLVAWLRDGGGGGGHPVRVVDVREGDFKRTGTKIRGAVNVPAYQIRADGGRGLVEMLRCEPIVVFHCMYSQQRGPSSALIYLRAAAAAGAEQQRQEVYVLRGGFDGFFRQYAADCPELFEPARRE